MIDSAASERRKRIRFIKTTFTFSGTAIGALISEAEFGQSNADKMSIALKEANETKYWLELLTAANYISQNGYEQIYNACKEHVAMLVATTKSLKNKNL